MEHAALLPFAPCALSGARAADGALTLTWHRRARFGGEWKDGRDVPLCETEERYEVDVSDGGVLLRTIVARSETAVYSAAEQVSDGVLPGAPVTIAVAQVSSVAGRGRPTSGIF